MSVRRRAIGGAATAKWAGFRTADKVTISVGTWVVTSDDEESPQDSRIRRGLPDSSRLSSPAPCTRSMERMPPRNPPHSPAISQDRRKRPPSTAKRDEAPDPSAISRSDRDRIRGELVRSINRERNPSSVASLGPASRGSTFPRRRGWVSPAAVWRSIPVMTIPWRCRVTPARWITSASWPATRTFAGSTASSSTCTSTPATPEGQGPGPVSVRGIEVTSPAGGPPAYVGPPHEDVPTLMGELVDWIEHRDLDAHVAVRGSRSDGAPAPRLRAPVSRRQRSLSRIVQSLVLAPGRPADTRVRLDRGAPGPQHRRVPRGPSKVQGGAYQPDRDAAP